MVILQDQMPDGAETVEKVTTSIILPSVQAPPLVAHWLIMMEFAFFPHWLSPNSYWVILK
jgi:hypothetical protein